MQIITSIPELCKLDNTALVPTMGNLHEGHLSLVEKAKSVAEKVVVSIFVNPLQFGPTEDFATYPRTFEQDCEHLEQLGVDVIFAPLITAIYPNGMEASTYVQVPQLGEILCGASRPIFFKGVTTVVNILFNLVQPDKALFGEKDYQQLFLIKRMVKDLFMPVEIIGMPIVREADGLAMSSRNNYLTVEQRATAPILFQTIDNVRDRLKTGERDFAKLEQQAIAKLIEADFEPDYFKVYRTDLTIPTSNDSDLVILAAANLGTTRLIDNCQV
ncbi:pantoate--beta-alanine ligase [Candidatus Halobeggiatoa sp. HSG11]|nr:pantoate--beta-alanine ligase [Candidatus Halobeggiatoa sp. HSG11]